MSKIDKLHLRGLVITVTKCFFFFIFFVFWHTLISWKWW